MCLDMARGERPKAPVDIVGHSCRHAHAEQLLSQLVCLLHPILALFKRLRRSKLKAHSQHGLLCCRWRKL